jgi:hypothetical protein
MSSLADQNRPLRVFEKILGGGLGNGNIGVVMSRHGTGKVALLTSIALDHAMDGKPALHVALGKSVSSVRAFDDEVLDEILNSLDVQDRAEILTVVERNKQIYTYPAGEFGPKRLRSTLTFLRDHAEFVPQLIELQGWPNFESVTPEEVNDLREVAREFECEIWCTAHTHVVEETDDRGVPSWLTRFDDELSAIIELEPESDHLRLKFIKTPGDNPEGVHLEFDPRSMLVRWR